MRGFATADPVVRILLEGVMPFAIGGSVGGDFTGVGELGVTHFLGIARMLVVTSLLDIVGCNICWNFAPSPLHLALTRSLAIW